MNCIYSLLIIIPEGYPTCEECNYSTPTFYRKMRGVDRRIDGRLIPALSNAEKQKIREIWEGVIGALSAVKC